VGAAERAREKEAEAEERVCVEAPSEESEEAEIRAKE